MPYFIDLLIPVVEIISSWFNLEHMQEHEFLSKVETVKAQGLSLADQDLQIAELEEEFRGSTTRSLAAFHTVFNITNLLLLFALVPILVKISMRLVKKTEGDDEYQSLKFIDTSNKTPELATVELQKEVARYGEITTRMLGFSKQLINTAEDDALKETVSKIQKYEDITDRFEKEITEYITNLSDQEVTHKTSIQLRSYFNICNDMERIGDIFYQFSKSIESKIERKTYFLPEQRNHLNQLFQILERAFEEMNNNLNLQGAQDIDLARCYALEDEINNKRNEMRDYNQKNLGKKDYDINAAMIFTNLFSSLERIGDHLVNINESVAGEI